MKKFNLISRLLSYSHEKQTPQRFGRYAVMLLLLLSCVTHAWADESFNDIWGTYDTGSGNTSESFAKDKSLGNVSKFTIQAFYLKCHDNWGASKTAWNGGALYYSFNNGDFVEVINNATDWKPDGWAEADYQFKKESMSLTLVENHSGNYSVKFYGKVWGSKGDTYKSKGSGDWTWTFTILPPALSSFSVSATSGNLAGNGSYANPYLVAYNGSLALSASSGGKAHTDDNSSLQIKYGDASYSATTTKTISSITSTDIQSIEVKGSYYNSSATLRGAESTQIIYYKVATYAITLDDNGSYQKDGSATAAYMRTTLTGITAPQRTGYDVAGYYGEGGLSTYIADASGNLQPSKTVSSTAYTNSSSQWVKQSATTLYTDWTAHTYTVTLKPGIGSTSSDGSLTVDYDATAINNDMSHSISQTGYHISGWYNQTAVAGSVKVLEPNGTFAGSSVSGYITSSKWSKASDCDLYAWWEGNAFTVAFNNNGGSGSMSSQNFVYGTSQNLTSNTFTKDGYQFDGWATASDGAVVYANGADGCTITSTADATVTLYAHWTKVEVEDLTFEPATSAGSVSVTVTPVLSGTPTGTSSICWGLYYDSDCTREVAGITFVANPSAGAASVTFTTPAYSGSYYVKATYLAGNNCSGTVLDTYVEQYVVASEHTVTIKYMQGSTEIASRSNVVVPAASTALVKPIDIFGYYFSSWEASEGISISDPTEDELEEAGLTGVANVKKVSAVIDGTLTAKYNRKDMIFFKNTLGWSDVYIHFNGSTYWNTSDGTGHYNMPNRNKHMEHLDGTDIWYFDYGAASITPNDYLVFTDRSYDNYGSFHNPSGDPAYPVVYPIIRSNSEQNGKGYGFNAGTPMFVPLNQTGTKKYSNKAIYYNEGYWRDYVPATGATGYTLKIYNHKNNDGSREVLYSIPMVDAPSGSSDIFVATIDLEAGQNYGVKIVRNNSIVFTNTSSDISKNENTYIALTKEDNETYAAAGLATTVAGEYTIKVTCQNTGLLAIAAKYPAAAGDYQLVYTDETRSFMDEEVKKYRIKPSDIVRKVNNGTDIVSFFVRKDEDPQIQMQNCALDGSGNVSWSNYGEAIDVMDNYSSVITEDGVYNFHLSMNESGALSISKVEPYTGEFYIRTDAVGGTKWADFRNDAHKMNYSDYAAANKGYTHYYVNWVGTNSNVKFTVANDYSPCISDTLVEDPVGKVVATIVAAGNDDAGKMTSANANIRFMYNVKDNSIKRAYLAGGQDPGSRFLVLQGEAEKLLDSDGNALTGYDNDHQGNNRGGGVNAMQLEDKMEWLYKASVKAVPGGKVKLYARYNSVDQYSIGKAELDDWTTSDAYEVLLSGDGGAQKISVVYDFKSDRMIAAWEPANEINTEMTLNADIMIVREHQESAANITFSASDKSLTTGKTVYGVMRFNRYTLNNHSTTGDHALLPVGDQLPLRERNHYYISFPFDVNVSDIFGFGTYGVHWVLQYYDGKARAKNGLWADPGMTYWKYVPPTGKLNAYEGYLLALSPSQMAYDNTAEGQVWHNGRSEVELYFPDATKGATIGVTNVTIPAPSSDYECTIWRGRETGEHAGDSDYDRRRADSYWRCIGVPSFKDYSTSLSDGTSAYAWVDPAAYESGDIHFLYEVQWTDYSLRAVSGSTYDFKAMHAYITQNNTAIVWSSVNAIKSSVVARRQKAEEISNYEFRLTLNQSDEVADQTFVRLTDDENVTNGFEFGQDLSKELYSTRAQIYTYIGLEKVAANSMPFTEQTTIVPVGVKVVADGDYTFAMPDGTHGVGITLVDNETGIRTNISALDYTINLSAGDYTDRFFLEIAPIKPIITDIENTEYRVQSTDVRKVLIDNILYIVKDGKMFDAQGRQVK